MDKENAKQQNGFFNFDFDKLGKKVEEFMKKNNVNDFWGADFANKTPLVNVYESEKGLDIELAAPGLEKEDFTVTVENHQLIVSTAQTVNKKLENVKIKRKEYDYSTFTRSFRLSDIYDLEKVTARYKKGILKVSVQKKEVKKKSSTRVDVS